MSGIRKKYFSASLQQFVDINTSQLVQNSSGDIQVAGASDERVRLIRRGTPINSSRLLDLVADLIYNDIQAYVEANKTISLLSDGIFPNILSEFKADSFDTVSTLNEDDISETFYTKFLIGDGILKCNKETFEFKSSRFYSSTSFTLGSSTITLPSQFSVNTKVGQVVSGSGIAPATQVQSLVVSGDTLTVTLNKPTITDQTNTVIEFANIPVFSLIGTTGIKNIPDITSIEEGKLYRRDRIEIDTKGNFYYIQGRNSTVKPPIHTQLDARYKITSIVYVSTNRYRVNFAESSRDFSEYQVGDPIDLQLTANGNFDGVWTILSKSVVGVPWVEIDVKKYNSDDLDQTEAMGYAHTNRLVLYSITLFRHDIGASTVILEALDRVAEFVGLDSSNQFIQRAEIRQDDNGFYGVQTKERKHILNSRGEFLDWADGQSASIPPTIGYAYNDELNQYEEKLTFFDETQITGLFDYENLQESALTNIPFLINIDATNIFGVSQVEVNSFKLGIRNNVISIGDEGMRVQLRRATPLITNRIPKVFNSDSLTTLQDINASFTTMSLVPNVDFVLITEGKGKYQVAKIVEVNSPTTLTLSGLTKTIGIDTINSDFTSEYQIFRGTGVQDVGQEAVITAQEIRSQVISGINGRFGNENEFSKVQISFPNPIQVNLKEWYFISIKVENANPPTVGQLPYIVIENPLQNISNTRTRQAFIEVFFQTFSGSYPSGNFLIEDEFGDISTEFVGRTFAPHFRPKSYKLVAVPLEGSGNLGIYTPPTEDVVYVDTHSGRFRFHPQGKPRKVFVSYYKRDALNGASTDFSIKHIDFENFNKINAQDISTKMYSFFTNGGKIEKPVVSNGLIQETKDGSKGSQKVDDFDQYASKFREAHRFENHNVEIEKFDVKYAKHDVRKIATVEKDKIVSEEPLNTQGSIRNGILYASNEGVGSPKVGLNATDIRLFPSGDALTFSRFFKVKKFDSPPYIGDNWNSDRNFIDNRISQAVNGRWNDINIYDFGDFNLTRIALRKSSTENIYPYKKGEKFFVKQRETAKITDALMGNLQNSKSTILSEQYFSKKNNSYKHTTYKGENLLYAYSEMIDTNTLEILPNVNRNDVDSPSPANGGFPSTNFKFSNTKMIDGKLYTSFVSASNDPFYSSYNVAKSDVSSEINEFDQITNDLIGNDVDVNGSNNIMLFELNENQNIALISTNANTLVAKVQSKIPSVDDPAYSLITIHNDSLQQLLGYTENDLTFHYFTGVQLERNLLGVMYRTTNGTFFKTVTYNPFTNEHFVSSASSILAQSDAMLDRPKLVKFSDGYVLAFYYMDGKLAFKKFDYFGITQIFKNGQQEITVSNSSYGSERMHFDVIQNENNDINIFYNERSGASSTLVCKTYREFDETFGETIALEPSVPIADRPKDISFDNLNSDFICGVYRTDQLKMVVTQLDGVPCRSARFVADSEDYYEAKVFKITDNSFGVEFKYQDSPTEIKYGFYAYEFRPNFNSYLKSWTPSASFASGSGVNALVKPVNANLLALGYINSGVPTFKKLNSFNTIEEVGGSFATQGIADSFDFGYSKYFSEDNSEYETLLLASTSGTTTTVSLYRISGLADLIDSVELDSVDKVRVYKIDDKNFLLVGNHTVDGIFFRAVSIQSIENEVATFTEVGNFSSIIILTGSLPTQNFDAHVNNNGSTVELFVVCDKTSSTSVYVVNYTKTNFTGASQYDLSVFGATNGQKSISQKENMIAVSFIDSGACHFSVLTKGATVYQLKTGFTTSVAYDLGTGVESCFVKMLEENYILSQTKETASPYTIKTQVFDVTDSSPITDIVLKQEIVNIFGEHTMSGKMNLFDMGNNFFVSSVVSGTNTRTMVFKGLPLNTDYSSPLGKSGNLAHSYICSGIKIAGYNFRGDYLKPKYIWKEKVTDLPQQMLVNGFHRSEILESDVSLLSFSARTSTAIFHSPSFRKLENNVRSVNWAVSSGRIFRDSEVFASTTLGDAFNFSSENLTKKIHLRTIKFNNRTMYIFKDQVDGRIKYGFSNSYNDLTNSAIQVLMLQRGNSEITNYDNIIVLESRKLINEYGIVLLYDTVEKEFFTSIVDSDGVEMKRGTSFELPEIDLDDPTMKVSSPTIDSFGFTLFSYLEEGFRKYLQVGIDGESLGIAEVVGKNIFEKITAQMLDIKSDAKIFGNLKVYGTLNASSIGYYPTSPSPDSDNATSNIVDFTESGFVFMDNPPLAPTEIVFRNLQDAGALRMVYLIVRSNGNYAFADTSEQGGNVLFPSDFQPAPSGSGRFDIYSFLTNGKSYFSFFAYNYGDFI